MGKLEIECCVRELDYRVPHLVAECVYIEMIESKGGVGTGKTTWPDTGLLMVVAIAIVNVATESQCTIFDARLSRLDVRCDYKRSMERNRNRLFHELCSGA